MIDVDCMIRSLRLGWLQRVFNHSSATWKRYFVYLLEHVGGIFSLSCNFDVKDFKLPCPFYYELLQWWSEFRDTFAEEKDYKNTIWNNKEIKIVIAFDEGERFLMQSKSTFLEFLRGFQKIFQGRNYSGRMT